MGVTYDIVVVGAGIAGTSVAAGLARNNRVAIIEAEDTPGYHATGRSAAFWTESYGGPGVVPLTIASGPFLRNHDLLTPRGALTLAREGEHGALDAFIAEYGALGIRIEKIERSALERRLPGLNPDWQHGAFEPDCCDINVTGLHQLWMNEARRHGADVLCRAKLTGASRQCGAWQVSLADGRCLSAKLLINAAGAWADEVAQAAGLSPIGIAPLRRTVVQLKITPQPSAALPLILGIDGCFYFKPEAGKLWLSPHDENPSPPCDAAPEEYDVALAMARFEAVVDWRVTTIERRWAGLRSFAPDRLPVYGFDPDSDHFFWFAGQGGFGIQTAPAASDLALRLLNGEAPGAVDPTPYSPKRFRTNSIAKVKCKTNLYNENAILNVYKPEL